MVLKRLKALLLTQASGSTSSQSHLRSSKTSGSLLTPGTSALALSLATEIGAPSTMLRPLGITTTTSPSSMAPRCLNLPLSRQVSLLSSRLTSTGGTLKIVLTGPSSPGVTRVPSVFITRTASKASQCHSCQTLTRAPPTRDPSLSLLPNPPCPCLPSMRSRSSLLMHSKSSQPLMAGRATNSAKKDALAATRRLLSTAATS
mmetsp:Transcript_5634/g.7513  ORF Transcript_5634/g.7513 Transcript_5634/m.7513 type:complete len:202 (-) Transcript_5634:443-1048(-)